MFEKKSRYFTTPEHTIEDASGRTVRYKGIRYIPSSRIAGLHEVTEGERLDGISHLHLGDPEEFWMICDINDAMWPDDLLQERDHRIRIPEREE